MSITAMKLALDYLNDHQMGNHVRAALKEALAKQEQGEPVGEAYLCDQCSTPFDGAWECPSCGHNTSTKEPIYTTPQQRKPLTREMIDRDFHGRVDFVRQVEAAHGIKENT
jgi:tRNA G26 N,N-dimethylase Trm1